MILPRNREERIRMIFQLQSQGYQVEYMCETFVGPLYNVY